MARKKSRFTFHGAFKSKQKAARKERSVRGFIVERRIHGQRRYVVMKERG